MDHTKILLAKKLIFEENQDGPFRNNLLVDIDLLYNLIISKVNIKLHKFTLHTYKALKNDGGKRVIFLTPGDKDLFIN